MGELNRATNFKPSTLPPVSFPRFSPFKKKISFQPVKLSAGSDKITPVCPIRTYNRELISCPPSSEVAAMPNEIRKNLHKAKRVRRSKLRANDEVSTWKFWKGGSDDMSDYGLKVVDGRRVSMRIHDRK